MNTDSFTRFKNILARIIRVVNQIQCYMIIFSIFECSLFLEGIQINGASLEWLPIKVLPNVFSFFSIKTSLFVLGDEVYIEHHDTIFQCVYWNLALY